MVIAFEGMDGVGKSTVAKEFAKQNQIIYEQQKIVNLLNIDEKDFKKFIKIIRNSKNQKLSLMFYTYRCMLDNEGLEDIVIERTMASTYFFEKEKIDSSFWDYTIGLGIIPNLTFLLYAPPEVRIQRIYKRDNKDPDLTNLEAIVDGYGDMLEYLQRYNAPYVGINTQFMDSDEVVTTCSNIYKEFINIEDYDEKRRFLVDMNDQYGIDELYGGIQKIKK